MVVTGKPLAEYKEPVPTDASIVRSVLSGDGSAFTQLVDRHARGCLRFATRMLGNREDAEDVTQEAFVRAHNALARYDDRLAFKTWLMTILVNRCRSFLLHRARREARVVAHDAVDSLGSEPARDNALRDAIEIAIAKLDTDYREAFLLKHVEQLSYDEMSALTGVGVSALKMRVQRACERLQVFLGEDRYA